QFRQGSVIIGKMIGLAANGLRPVEAEPAKVFHDGSFEFGPRPRGVDVFDAQQEEAVMSTGKPPVQHGGAGMSDMEQPVRTGREADNRSAQMRVGCGAVVWHDVS